ncbi:MAG: DUF972 family protein [Thermoanaerobacter sp.]|nr:DUF972 family protein [Thermoanaerobacter sp.]
MIKEMEAKIQTLGNDMQKLKKQIRLLMEENDKLREELARAYGQASENIPAREGLKNLWDLYQQGFHICNVHFGRIRTTECLFCEAFWDREREGGR